MRRPAAAFLSAHSFTSKRRAGFHWLADAYRRAGWRILFVTVGPSRLSALRGDWRLEGTGPADWNRVVRLDADSETYLWVPPFHPANLGNAVANRLVEPLWRLTPRFAMPGLPAWLAAADQIVVESAGGIMLVPRLRALAPSAHLVYRVSDDLDVIGAHPLLGRIERRVAPLFDLISLPSPRLARRFAGLETVTVHRHGVPVDLIRAPQPSPFPEDGRVRVLSLGHTVFDAAAANAATAALPDWEFHVFGLPRGLAPRPNLVQHGERPFAELIPYLQHAQVGAAFYRAVPGADYLVDTSNKIAQYACAGLPIVAPGFLEPDRNDVFCYDSTVETSIGEAFLAAGACDRSSLAPPPAESWDTVAARLMPQRAGQACDESTGGPTRPTWPC